MTDWRGRLTIGRVERRLVPRVLVDTLEYVDLSTLWPIWANGPIIEMKTVCERDQIMCKRGQKYTHQNAGHVPTGQNSDMSKLIRVINERRDVPQP